MSGVRSDIGPYALCPEWLLDRASGTALRVWLTLAMHADRKNGQAFPRRNTLAKRLGCSVDTIDRAKAELVEAGALLVEPQYDEAGDQKENLYTVLFVPPGGRTDAATGGRADAAPRTRISRNQSATTSNEVVAAGDPDEAPKLVKINDRNLPWDALAGECNLSPSSRKLTSVARALGGDHKTPGIRTLAWREIVERGGRLADSAAVEQAIADLVHERAAMYRQVMREAVLTPTALWDWWERLPAEHARRSGRRGELSAMEVAAISADEQRRMREEGL